MNEICERIKLIRNAWEINQTEFAKRISVTNAHISKIEKGNTVPSPALIKLICQTYKISESWLLTGKEPMFDEDLEDLVTQTMNESNDLVNKLFRQTGIVRANIVELEFQYAQFVSIDLSSELDTAEYLSICYKLLSHINQFLDVKKKSMIDMQITFPIEWEDTAKKIKFDIEDFENFFSRREPQQ